MNAEGAHILGLVGVAVAVLAIVIYFVVIFRRPNVTRLLNGSGLFLTGLALSQAPFLLHPIPANRMNATFAVVLLIMAVAAQGLAALRHRKAWDGTERRIPEPWDRTTERRKGDA